MVTTEVFRDSTHACAVLGAAGLGRAPCRWHAGGTAITRSHIQSAHTRIRADIRTTPVLELPEGVFGPALNLKLELTQVTGSFKPRGAFNRLRLAGDLSRGVVAASGGNHGAAVAYAAQAMSVRANIFVPEVSAAEKQARIRSYGAHLVVGGARYADALAASQAHRDATGALEVHAYDQPEVLAGQGTVALEWEAQAPRLTHLLVAVGGGGLIGGMAAWHAGCATEVIAVEPESSCALHAALAAGKPVEVPVSGVAADSLGAKQVGAAMFPIAAQNIRTSVLVADDAIRAAQSRLWEAARVLAEPGGATALAALLSGAWVPPKGARVGVLVCGGNTAVS